MLRVWIWMLMWRRRCGRMEGRRGRRRRERRKREREREKRGT
jgi:hypothetical protein